MSELRAAFWREVRSKCWTLSRGHFQWLYPLAAGLFVLVFVGLVQGWERVMDNAIPALAAGGFALLTALVVYGVNFVRATNAVVDAMRVAEYSEGVSFRAEVLLDTVVLHIRHRIETGFFSAQLWMLDGGVPLSTPNHSLAWGDTTAPRRVLVNGEDHVLRLMRFEVAQPGGDDQLSVRGVICGPGGSEPSTPLIGQHIGRDSFHSHPIILRLNVTDSAEQSRRVVVWVSVRATKARYPTISAHLVREW